jgi:hypothetical protein
MLLAFSRTACRTGHADGIRCGARRTVAHPPACYPNGAMVAPVTAGTRPSRSQRQAAAHMGCTTMMGCITRTSVLIDRSHNAARERTRVRCAMRLCRRRARVLLPGARGGPPRRRLRAYLGHADVQHLQRRHVAQLAEPRARKALPARRAHLGAGAPPAAAGPTRAPDAYRQFRSLQSRAGEPHVTSSIGNTTGSLTGACGRVRSEHEAADGTDRRHASSPCSTWPKCPLTSHGNATQ